MVSKYSNELDFRHDSGLVSDEKEYMLKSEVIALLEQTRSNTIDAAIAALPEKGTLIAHHDVWDRYVEKYGTPELMAQALTVDQAKSNILKLKKG